MSKRCPWGVDMGHKGAGQDLCIHCYLVVRECECGKILVGVAHAKILSFPDSPRLTALAWFGGSSYCCKPYALGHINQDHVGWGWGFGYSPMNAAPSWAPPSTGMPSLYPSSVLFRPLLLSTQPELSRHGTGLSAGVAGTPGSAQVLASGQHLSS